MAGKRSHIPDRQNQPKKKFKPSPGGIKSQGGPKQIGNGKANKALGSGGKRKNPKALQKWKKKKVYVFKTTKRLKTSLGTPSVVNDGGKLTEDNLAVQKDLNKEKKKKKRRKKKKKKQKDTNTTETPADAVNNGKQNVTGKTGKMSFSASEILKESVVNTEKKKKKKQKSKKKKKANGAALAGPDESGDVVSHSKNLNDESVVDNAGQKSRGDKKSKRTNVKVNPTTVTNEEQSNSKKTSEVKSSANDILNGEKKRQGKKSTGLKKWPIGGKGDGGLLPRKPQDISANWKALLPKLDKPKPSKFRNAKQEQSKRPSEIWFDDVDPELLKTNDLTGSGNLANGKSSKSDKGVFVIDGAEEGPTKCVALDCEMVGAGHGGRNNILARVSVVNQYGHCLYDKFVRSREEVTDYRTWVSGVRKADLDNGEDFMTVQKEVADMLKGKILVGHALQNDMKVLFLDHPKRMMRDTYHYEPFREMFKSRRPGLKSLVEKILNVKVQQGEHSSVEDAQAVMKLYMLHRKKWETSLKMKPTKKSTT